MRQRKILEINNFLIFYDISIRQNMREVRKDWKIQLLQNYMAPWESIVSNKKTADLFYSILLVQANIQNDSQHKYRTSLCTLHE